MFTRAYIPRNAQPTSKHGVFTNDSALTFRIYAIYKHAPEFCTRLESLKKSFNMNHPVEFDGDVNFQI